MFPSCEIKKQTPFVESSIAKVEVKPKNIKYGFDIDQYRIVKKKIKRGDTFGSILEENGIDYPEVYNILKVLKNKVNYKSKNNKTNLSKFQISPTKLELSVAIKIGDIIIPVSLGRDDVICNISVIKLRA